MNYRQSFKTSIHTAWIIIKLIIPMYILADVLFYYNVLSHIAFIFEPITSILSLPVETSLAIISGMFLNLYAAIAFAAPLDLTPKEWTILAIYLGICHSLIVEGAIVKKLGFSYLYSNILRVASGLSIGYLSTYLPDSLFSQVSTAHNLTSAHYNTMMELLWSSAYNAIVLTIKIIAIITALIFIMDFIKHLPFIQNSKKNISKSFSMGIGTFLGITYGAGLLIQEAKTQSMHQKDLFYVVTFLMICHAIIEDTLLFAIFGANITIIIVVRTIAAIIIAYILTKLFYKA